MQILIRYPSRIFPAYVPTAENKHSCQSNGQIQIDIRRKWKSTNGPIPNWMPSAHCSLPFHKAALNCGRGAAHCVHCCTRWGQHVHPCPWLGFSQMAARCAKHHLYKGPNEGGRLHNEGRGRGSGRWQDGRDSVPSRFIVMQVSMFHKRATTLLLPGAAADKQTDGETGPPLLLTPQWPSAPAHVCGRGQH